jgi:hypothetical protein
MAYNVLVIMVVNTVVKMFIIKVFRTCLLKICMFMSVAHFHHISILINTNNFDNLVTKLFLTIESLIIVALQLKN